jgi:hypothetical protein
MTSISSIDSDFAYFLGLLIGGGEFNPNSITIEFPYKRWAHEDFRISPEWFNDSVSKIAPLVQNLINATAKPRFVTDYTPRYYIEITPIPQLLSQTLQTYGIRAVGKLREHASLASLAPALDADCGRRFIQGLADVIGSCRASHRHRSLASTIISFEILGVNWNLPMQLCHLLYSLKVPVDQILYNHPNMHAGSDPTAYWKKGHKVRVKAGDFRTVGYGLECKRIGLEALLKKEQQNRGTISVGELCPRPHRGYKLGPPKVNHVDENSTELPSQVRGHFIHFTDICRAQGCPYAPRRWLDEQYRRHGY